MSTIVCSLKYKIYSGQEQCEMRLTQRLWEVGTILYLLQITLELYKQDTIVNQKAPILSVKVTWLTIRAQLHVLPPTS